MKRTRQKAQFWRIVEKRTAAGEANTVLQHGAGRGKRVPMYSTTRVYRFVVVLRRWLCGSNHSCLDDVSFYRFSPPTTSRKKLKLGVTPPRPPAQCDVSASTQGNGRAATALLHKLRAASDTCNGYSTRYSRVKVGTNLPSRKPRSPCTSSFLIYLLFWTGHDRPKIVRAKSLWIAV